MRCACVTGHRRLSRPEAVRRSLAAALEEALRAGYGRFFVGMALGADQMAAELLVGRAEVVAVLPCEDYDRLWPAEARRRYREILERVGRVVCYPGGPYEPWKPHARNRWMVDRSELVVAVYDGRRRGGTYRTVRHAGARGVPVRLVWGMLIRFEEPVSFRSGRVEREFRVLDPRRLLFTDREGFWRYKLSRCLLQERPWSVVPEC